jgi:methionyl-tRNA synthetase
MLSSLWYAQYRQVLEQLQWRAEDARLRESLVSKAGALETIVPVGHRIGTPAVLFRTIPKEEEDALRARFAGSQAERASAAAAAGTSGGSGAKANGAAPDKGAQCVAQINP